MTYLLDTNTCVRYLNGRSPGVRQRLLAEKVEDVAVCSVVKAELFFGAFKSRDPNSSLTAQREFWISSTRSRSMTGPLSRPAGSAPR